jgi:hypothetical protein
MSSAMRRCPVLLAIFAVLWPLGLLAAEGTQPEAGVVRIVAVADGKRKVGTGFVVKLEPELAYIVTAAHVVEGAQQTTVEFYTKQHSPVRAEVPRIEGGNPRGFALLVVRGEKSLPTGVSALPLASSSTLKPRDQVEVIGFPEGGGGWAVVSAQVSSREGAEWILTGAIDEGSSGGPALKDAVVVGMVMSATAKFGRANPASQLRETLEGWGVVGLGQAAAGPAGVAPTDQQSAGAIPPPPTAASTSASRKVKGARQLATLRGHDDDVLKVAFNRNGKTLASVSKDGIIILWDVAARKTLIKTHIKAATNLAFSPDGNALASSSADATVVIREAASLEPIGPPLKDEECRGGVWSVAFSPDGKTLAAACENDTVYVWDVAKRTPLATFGSCDAPISLAFSPDNRRLAAGGVDGCIVLWDVATHAASGMLGKRVNSRPIASVAFSPDSKVLASANATDAAVILWDPAAREPIGEALRGHTQPVFGVAFSPDGQTLASASVDQTVILWDVATRKPLAEPLKGHSQPVISVAFSPDGRLLASASADKTVILWELIFE